MSWKSGTNNIHFDMPPMMNDGRNYATWYPESVVNSKIKKKKELKAIGNTDNTFKIMQIIL